MSTFLFITKYLEGNMLELQREIHILAVPYGTVFLAIVLDLVAGLVKASRLGEMRTSVGLRRTVSKFRDYYSMLLIATLIDILLSVMDVYELPYITFACGIYLTFIEGMSIREKGDDKMRRKNNQDLKAIITVLENRGDLMKSFVEIVKEEVKELEEIAEAEPLPKTEDQVPLKTSTEPDLKDSEKN